MTRGARQLTKKEKDKLKLLSLIDAHDWLLMGTLVPVLRPISRVDLKKRVEKAINPRTRFLNGRHVVILDINSWAEQILPQDKEE